MLSPGKFLTVSCPACPSSTTFLASGIFKTAPTTQAPPKTPAAVFFRTATEKSVRVVTSSSFVTGPAVPLPQKQPLKDIQPQRHEESQSLDVVSQGTLRATTQPQKGRVVMFSGVLETLRAVNHFPHSHGSLGCRSTLLLCSVALLVLNQYLHIPFREKK